MESIDSNFISCCIGAEKKQAQGNKGLQHASRFYYHLHSLGNDAACVGRATKNISEIWHAFSNTVTLAFSSTKFLAILSSPGEILDIVSDIKGFFSSKKSVDKVAYATNTVATTGNITLNTWTFVQAVNSVTSISRPALHFLDIAGPVGWGVSVLALIKAGREHYKDQKIVAEIKANKPTPEEGDASRYNMFKIFLLDGVYKIRHSDLMEKLRLIDRIPGIEAKYKIRSKVEMIARSYVATKNTEITQKFVSLVSKQYRMNRMFFAFKAIAVIAGLGALLFFYMPGMNHFTFSNHTAWALLILAGTVGVVSLTANKINSVLFMRELNRLALESEIKKWQMEMKANTLDIQPITITQSN